MMTDQEMLQQLEDNVELSTKELSVLVFKLVKFSVQQSEHNKGGHQVNLDIQTCLHAANTRLEAIEAVIGSDWTTIRASSGRVE